MRSSPSIARRDRSSDGRAASSAATGGGARRGRRAVAGTPLPTLSASRSANSSSSAVATDLADEPPDRRVAPARLVREHVVADEVDDPLGRRSAAVEPVEELLGQLGADACRGREMAVGLRSPACRCRGAAPPAGRSGGRRRRVDRPERVVPEVLARDLVLGDAALGGELRRDVVEEPGLGQQPQPDRRPGRRQQLVELGGDPLAGQVGDQRRRARVIAASVAGSIAEVEGRGEPDGADHPQRVLLEALAGSPTARRTRAATSAPAAERVDELGARVVSGAAARPASGRRPRRSR